MSESKRATKAAHRESLPQVHTACRQPCRGHPRAQGPLSAEAHFRARCGRGGLEASLPWALPDPLYQDNGDGDWVWGRSASNSHVEGGHWRNP